MKHLKYLLIAFVCINFSCSSDADYSQVSDNDREVLAQKVETLAKEYDLNFSIDRSKPFEKDCNLDTLENIFKGLAKVRGKYQLSTSKENGKYEAKVLPRKGRRNVITRALESFTFSPHEIPYYQYNFLCHCTARWYTNKDAVSDGGCVTAYVEERDNRLNGSSICSYDTYGGYSGITFRGTVKYTFGVYNQYHIEFKFSGDCTEKEGSISWV